MNKIVLKKSSVSGKTPQPEDLEYGELAVNYADGKLYFKNSSNVIKALSSSSTVDGNFAGVELNAQNLIINQQYRFPSFDGVQGQVITTDGTGQLIFASVDALTAPSVGGFSLSTLTSFPRGDYGELTALSYDPFGVELIPVFTCMEPRGSLQQFDLGLLT